MLLLFCGILSVFAFTMSSPLAIYSGMRAILTTPDILITDYIYIGGVGAAFANAATVGIFSILLLRWMKVVPDGSTIMALWLIVGFSFFGKNLFNMLPILLGGICYSLYRKKHFSNYCLVTLLATSLSPAVSQISFIGVFPLWIAYIVGSLLGMTLGFIIAPIASRCMHTHEGYNLYNVGFAAGLLATLVMALMKNAGIEFSTVMLVSSENSIWIFWLLIFISLLLIVAGCWAGENNIAHLRMIYISSGRLVSDYFRHFHESVYINMGLLGLFSTLFVMMIGGELSGPVIGGIFTIIGFGGYGKHLRNIIPVMAGSFLAAVINVNAVNSPVMVMSILFSTCVAPISGRFGWPYGIIAGFLHVNIVSNLGNLSGGLNLYNNGLAGGIVAMLLVPVIKSLRRARQEQVHPEKEKDNRFELSERAVSKSEQKKRSQEKEVLVEH